MKQRMVKSGSPVYELIEKHIKAVATMSNPATCVSLMEIGELREGLLDEFGGKDRDVRRTTNQLSNTLGFMWRKNILVRMPAKERNSKTRWAYVWNTQGESDTPAPLPQYSQGTIKKPVLNIEQIGDELVIEFEAFIVKIKQK